MAKRAAKDGYLHGVEKESVTTSDIYSRDFAVSVFVLHAWGGRRQEEQLTAAKMRGRCHKWLEVRRAPANGFPVRSAKASENERNPIRILQQKRVMSRV